MTSGSLDVLGMQISPSTIDVMAEFGQAGVGESCMIPMRWPYHSWSPQEVL